MSTQVDILVYTEYFLPIVGGVQTSVNLLASGLAGAPQAGAPIEKVNVTVVTGTAAASMDDSALPYRVIRKPAFAELVRLIRNADVLHIAGPSLLPMAIAWFIRKPFVIEHHGYQSVCPNGLFLREPMKAVCPGYFQMGKYSECIQCVSSVEGNTKAIRSLILMFPRLWLSKKATVNAMITNYVGTRVKLPNARTIYYGIEDVAVGEVSSTRSSCLEIAYVGRLVPEKGLPLLVDAAAMLRDRGIQFKLHFIGDGPERSRLEQQIEKYNLNDHVSFTGDLRGTKLAEKTATIDVVVMPSIWEETAGLSAIEQMMRGKVVVAADIGGLSEVVGDAGLKFTPGDAQKLADCLARLADEPSLVSALCARARTRAMQLFRKPTMIANHLAMYSQMMSKEHPGLAG